MACGSPHIPTDSPSSPSSTTALPPCTSPAFLSSALNTQSPPASGPLPHCSSNRSAFLSLYRSGSLALSGLSSNVTSLERPSTATPSVAAACPCHLPVPPSLCSLTPSVFFFFFFSSGVPHPYLKPFHICFFVACLLLLTSLIKYKPLGMRRACIVRYCNPQHPRPCLAHT